MVRHRRNGSYICHVKILKKSAVLEIGHRNDLGKDFSQELKQSWCPLPLY